MYSKNPYTKSSGKKSPQTEPMCTQWPMDWSKTVTVSSLLLQTGPLFLTGLKPISCNCPQTYWLRYQTQVTVQFKMLSMPHLSLVFPMLPLSQFHVCPIDNIPLSSFQGRLSSASSFHFSFLPAIDGVTALALCPQVASQAPQHFRSEMQTTCDSCTACQFICLVIFHHSSMSRTVHPQDFSKEAVSHWHIPV